jgi:hypothetical protein
LLAAATVSKLQHHINAAIFLRLCGAFAAPKRGGGETGLKMSKLFRYTRTVYCGV